MKREINIRFTLPRAPRSWWTLGAVAVVASGALVYANVPNTFKSGDLLDAQKLNDDFNALVDLSTPQSIHGLKTFSDGVVLNGKIGIGTANPQGQVEIAGDDGAGVSFSLNATGAGGQFWTLQSTDGAASQGQGDLLFRNNTAGFDAMVISGSGNIGIGTATPAAPLTVGSSGNPDFNIGGPTTSFSISTAGGQFGPNSDMNFNVPSGKGFEWTQNGGQAMVFSPSRNLGVQNGNPSYNVDVGSNGTGTLRANVTNTSDIRLKTDIRTIEHPLDDIERLRGVRFKWKKDGKPSLGVIAQEVEQVYPELVDTDANGIKSVEYAQLAGVFIESTKALRAENAALKSRLAKLEARFDAIAPHASR